MKPERIRPVRRPRREDAGQRVARVASGGALPAPATGLVQPGDDDQLVARANPFERLRSPRVNLEPGIGRALRSLPRRLFALVELGADDAHWPQPRLHGYCNTAAISE